MERIVPTAMAILQLVAGGIYLHTGDKARGVFWLSCAVGGAGLTWL